MILNLRRERKSVSSRWNYVFMDTNSCWVIKLNAILSLWNHTIKLCIVDVVSNTILFLYYLCGYFGNINTEHSTRISLSLYKEGSRDSWAILRCKGGSSPEILQANSTYGQSQCTVSLYIKTATLAWHWNKTILINLQFHCII